MKILVVGSGAREHALVWKLASSRHVASLYCAPGNAGTASLAVSIPLSPDDTAGLVEWAMSNRPDLIVIGPEAPLAAGLVDRLREAGLRAFGPAAAAAQIESSKVWAKDFLTRHGIPTGNAFPTDDFSEARRLLDRLGLPVVVKADGLAAGKGVVVAYDRRTAERTLEQFLVEGRLGQAGRVVLLEEFLEGRELSVLAFSDGERVALMPPARDYKRVGDGDTGPNTGGMGAYARPWYATQQLLEEVRSTIVEPAVLGMAAEGRPFKGVLYAGLMVTTSGPKVLEFNCRFGDPEAQAILPLLESDLLQTMEACVEGRLEPGDVRWSDRSCCVVVLASGGYPGEYRTGFPVTGLERVDEGIHVFHAGTTLAASGQVVTSGGRVLSVAAVAPVLPEARRRAYRAAQQIEFETRYFRRDIALDEPAIRAATSRTDQEGPKRS